MNYHRSIPFWHDCFISKRELKRYPSAMVSNFVLRADDAVGKQQLFIILVYLRFMSEWLYWFLRFIEGSLYILWYIFGSGWGLWSYQGSTS